MVEPIKCTLCNKEIPQSEMVSGDAYHFFAPKGDFNPEISEWTCKACVEEHEDAE